MNKPATPLTVYTHGPQAMWEQHLDAGICREPLGCHRNSGSPPPQGRTSSPWIGRLPSKAHSKQEQEGTLRMGPEGTGHRCHADLPWSSCHPLASHIQGHPETPFSSSWKGKSWYILSLSCKWLQGRVTCLHISFRLSLSQPCYHLGILWSRKFSE